MLLSSIPPSKGSEMKETGISRRSILLAGGGVLLGGPVISSGVGADKGDLNPCPPECTWDGRMCYCPTQPADPPDDGSIPGKKGLDQAEGQPGEDGRDIARQKQQGNK
jgi:hypothetical protein